MKIKIQRTIILSIVLYGYEAWSLTMREQHRLCIFKNRVLRRVFGPRTDKVTWGQSRLHEELHGLYSKQVSRKITWAVHTTCMRDRRAAYMVWCRNLRDRVNLGRPRHSWEDNIKMYVEEI
jgi:hypothetical protein